ncbi:Flp family type IVb pilin [Salinarimonas sp.]|uniref:Flp family type IVb pilin n=1 Tax=Salinarimonas sp. TaxID=2766526 RepID=UPI00391B8765
MLRRFRRCRRGATAIEYGLVAAIMALIILGAFPPLKEAFEPAFEAIGDYLTERSERIAENGIQ